MKSATEQFMEHMELLRRNRYNLLQNQRTLLFKQMIHLLKKLNIVDTHAEVDHIAFNLVNRIFKYREY